MKLNSCSTLFQGKRKKATEQGDSAFFGNKIQHEGSTASQTEEQTGVYKNLASWRFWSERRKKLYSEAIDRSCGGIVELDALKRQLGETN